MQKWKCTTPLFIPIITSNWHLRKIYKYIAYRNKQKKTRIYLFIACIELNLKEDVRSFFKNEEVTKKKRNLPIKFHAKLCIDSKKFPPRLFLFDPEKRFDPGLKNVTGYNNANRDESTDTSQLKHPKIVCSTCNVRPYDVSRAGWKFFPPSPLAGISFATYATGISRGEGGRQGQAPPRASSSSLQIPTKYPGDTIGGSREKFSKLAIDRSLSAINEDTNWMEYFTIHNSPNLSSLFELIPCCVFIDQNEFFEMIPLLIVTLNNLELIESMNRRVYYHEWSLTD